jgi:hypothetical protein
LKHVIVFVHVMLSGMFSGFTIGMDESSIWLSEMIEEAWNENTGK